MKIKFNRNPLVYGKSIEQPSNDDIKSTFGLWAASLDDAVKYGGEITREAIKCFDLKFDRKYIIVDTKIHMLIPGFSPAILGWHTDGAPRDKNKSPIGLGPPNLSDQEDERFNHYHLMVTGQGCLTKFINTPIELELPDQPSYDVYKEISKSVEKKVKENSEIVSVVPSCTAVEFDWWDIHSGVIATKKEWRFFIRVTETDYLEPEKDLRKIIRMQHQVYCPENFAW